MKIRYDASVDAAYIQLKNDDDPTRFGFTYSCDPSIVNGEINLKFDELGRLIGIDVLDASKKLPEYLLRLD